MPSLAANRSSTSAAEATRTAARPGVTVSLTALSPLWPPAPTQGPSAGLWPLALPLLPGRRP